MGVPYRYSILKEEPHEIRILTLLPGSWDDEISCRLHKATLGANPKYEALSYAWGDPTDTKIIHLDGYAVKVTSNLEQALRYLRRPSEELSLWVDALCIDQSSSEEKSHQVGQMGSVYEQCSQVNIWIGHPGMESSSIAPKRRPINCWRKTCMGIRKALSWIVPRFPPDVTSTAVTAVRGPAHSGKFEHAKKNDNSDPFALIHHFYQDKHLQDLPGFYRSVITNALQFSETPLFLEQWGALRRLLECPWWSRFWCVQEALLPQQAVVIYGHWRIPWTIIKTAIQNHFRHLTTCCSDAEKLMGFPYHFEPDRLLIESDSIPGTSARQSTDPEHDLEMLLREYRYKDCKDPRDKVYGILGIVDKSTYNHLQPDYSLSVREVYTSAMRAIIFQHTEGLRFLTGMGFNSSHHDLPSWVRDFNYRPDKSVLRHEMTWMQAYNLYHCSSPKTNAVFIENNSYLHVKGVQIDKVAAVGTSLRSLDWRDIGSVFESWHKLAGIRIFERPWAHKQQRSFWRTILADTVFDVEKKQLRRSNAVDERELHKWLMQVLATWAVGLQPSLKDCFVLAMLAATYGRAMFVTSNGRLGLAYDRLKEGDEIWALRGGMVPFILRNHTQERDGFRALIGDCYLDEFMDGKALRPCYEERHIILN